MYGCKYLQRHNLVSQWPTVSVSQTLEWTSQAGVNCTNLPLLTLNHLRSTQCRQYHSQTTIYNIQMWSLFVLK